MIYIVQITLAFLEYTCLACLVPDLLFLFFNFVDVVSFIHGFLDSP